MRLAVLVAMLALYGCTEAAADDGVDEFVLKMEVDALKSQVDTLRDSVYDTANATRATALLEPSDNGTWLAVNSEVGPLMFILEDVEAHANGSRVTLRVGNPSNATVAELTANLEYGGMSPKRERSPVGDGIRHTFQEDIPPGAWRSYKVNLAGAPPNNLGYVEVSHVVVGRIRMPFIS